MPVVPGTFCRPGAKLNDITDMIKKLFVATRNNKSGIYYSYRHKRHGSFSKSKKLQKHNNTVYRASELIHEKYKNLTKALKSRNTQSYLVGMLRRFNDRIKLSNSGNEQSSPMTL